MEKSLIIFQHLVKSLQLKLAVVCLFLGNRLKRLDLAVNFSVISIQLLRQNIYGKEKMIIL